MGRYFDYLYYTLAYHSKVDSKNFCSFVTDNGAATRKVSTSASEGSKTKLIVNYLPQTMTDAEYQGMFSSLGAVRSLRYFIPSLVVYNEPSVNTSVNSNICQPLPQLTPPSENDNRSCHLLLCPMLIWYQCLPYWDVRLRSKRVLTWQNTCLLVFAAFKLQCMLHICSWLAVR